jgi:hypothetical protein
MPVEAQTVEYSYLGDGVSTVFEFPSRFLSNADLFVALNGVLQVAGFVITGAGTDNGGEVTFTVPPGNLVRVMIVRNPSPSQLIDFENGQTVLEGTLDNALDKLTMIAQYLLRSARRSVRIGDAAYTTEDPNLLSLPVVTARLSKILAFDENGAVEMIDRTGFEQLMQDAIASATTSVAAAASADSSAQAAAEALSDITLLLNGVSSAIRRKYIMTDGQTVIAVGPFTTNALFVYYDGVLLDPLGEYTAVSPTITLAAGAAAGAQIDVVEFKAVNVTNALIAANDLSDVSDKKNSRQNLEITKVMTGPNAAASISADSRVVLVATALTAPRVYTLPAANAVNPGEPLDIFDLAGGVTPTNTLTIQRAGADTINGGTSAVLSVARSGIRLVSDGVSKWVSAASAPTPRQVVQTFSANGTYTPTVGMVTAVVECVGAGGAAGGVVGGASVVTGGGGGGAGALSVKLVTAADIGASKAVTIGAGGVGASGANGGNGGDTSVGTLCVAKGGTGGAAGTAASQGNGGAGGDPATGTGDQKVYGSPGQRATYTSGTGSVGSGAPGGVGPYGGAAQQNAATTGSAAGGAVGLGPGSGGSGAVANFVAANQTGGNGAPGFVKITELVVA